MLTLKMLNKYSVWGFFVNSLFTIEPASDFKNHSFLSDKEWMY